MPLQSANARPFSPSQPVDALNLSDPRVRARLSPAAVDGFVRLAALWQLSALECCLLLGDLSERTWFRMKKQDGSLRLSFDLLTRISLLVGIFKGLRLLFSEELADQWMRLPNRGPLFNGRRPLDLAIEGGIPRLMMIRQHIDALRGGL
ncbi:antitoxin Xre/MbcA/ParS toxin-binding domain-containing protein [Rhizosaccharibacter radicis]|uniref:MbcA/ParS/Xre antitoxin family protein n=1 Tax=Rhizosaccharibacter radicis TaxID=2782605 RepID=A0ABT1VYX2_9PROT|nr:MbcA/ParS/Xre antitoxin family protein [Acetobacteraceae bacterium KSS12]